MAEVLDTVRAGGPIVWLLIAMSVATVALIVVTAGRVSRAMRGEAGRDRAFAMWGSGDKVGAVRSLGAASPADRLLARAMEGILAGRHRSALDADLEWRGNAEIAGLSRNVRLLELVAMVSPLLGLLGTVLGMIQAFRELALAEGAANASLLAAGIWQALLTTAAGLIVAIPAAVAAGLLASRVERAANGIEGAIGRLYALEDGAG